MVALTLNRQQKKGHNKMQSFVYYQDPGHGWIQVDTQVLEALGIDSKISSYSYISGTTAYLEEDCDAGLFIRAFEEKHGARPELVSRYSENIFIRDLPSYDMRNV